MPYFKRTECNGEFFDVPTNTTLEEHAVWVHKQAAHGEGSSALLALYKDTSERLTKAGIPPRGAPPT